MPLSPSPSGYTCTLIVAQTEDSTVLCGKPAALVIMSRPTMEVRAAQCQEHKGRDGTYHLDDTAERGGAV